MNNLQSLPFISSELVLVLFSFIALMGGVIKCSKNFPGTLSFLGVVLAALLFSVNFTTGSSLFFGMLVHDVFAEFFRMLILLIAGLVILISMGSKELEQEDVGEYYFFLLTVTVAMMLAVASNNLMLIYLTLESISIVSYIMAGFLKRDIFSSEGGVKYFLFGALSTGVALYGISLIYGLFGTLDLPRIIQILSGTTIYQPALILSLLLVLVGFGFKCSLVPFHMWTPDVYQGAPTPVAAFISVGPKAVGFAFLLRVFVHSVGPHVFPWVFLAGIISILTMTIGNIMALGQTNIKRLLAYSTIAQAGYILVGLTVATPLGIKATLFYLFVYSLMNLCAFGAVIMISNSIKSETIEDYAGLYKKDPMTAVILTISLLSLAGIPPLAGFLAKFTILAAAVEAKSIALAIMIVVNSVIALYYYVRVVKFMFLHEPQVTPPVSRSLFLQLALTVTVIGIVAVGIWPQPVMDWMTGLLQFK